MYTSTEISIYFRTVNTGLTPAMAAFYIMHNISYLCATPYLQERNLSQSTKFLQSRPYPH